MTAKGYVPRVTALLEEQAVAHGFDLVHVEFGGHAHQPLVRVYLDREGGLDIDAIASANAWVKDVLDVQPEFAKGYTLEVSSPGIERPLVKPADFERFKDSRVKVTTREPVGGRSHFTGQLLGMEGDEVLLEVDETTYRIPHETIRTARLRVDVDFAKEGT